MECNMITNQEETQLQLPTVQDPECFVTQLQTTSPQQSDQTEPEASQSDFLQIEETTVCKMVDKKSETNDSEKGLIFQKESFCERAICEADKLVLSPKQINFLNTEKIKDTDLERIEKETVISKQDIFHRHENYCESVIYNTDHSKKSPKQLDIVDTKRSKETALETVEIETEMQDARQNLLYQQESSGEKVLSETDQSVESPKQPNFLDTDTTKETDLETAQKVEMQHSAEESIMISDCKPGFLITEITKETALEIVEKKAEMQDSGQDSFHQKESYCERFICKTNQQVASHKKLDSVEKEILKEPSLKTVENETIVQDSGQDYFHKKEMFFDRVICETHQQVASTRKLGSLGIEITKYTDLDAAHTETEVQDSGQDLLCQKESSCERIICETDQPVLSTKQPNFLDSETTKEMTLETPKKETKKHDLEQHLLCQKETSYEKGICESDQEIVSNKNLDSLDTERTKEKALQIANIETQSIVKDICCHKESPYEKIIYETDQPMASPKQHDFAAEKTKDTSLKMVAKETKKQDLGQELLCETDQQIVSTKKRHVPDAQRMQETSREILEREIEMQELGQDHFCQKENSCGIVTSGTSRQIGSAEKFDFLVTKRVTETQIQDSGQDLLCQKESFCERDICDTGHLVESVQSPKQSDSLDKERSKETALGTDEIETQNSQQDFFYMTKTSCERVTFKTDHLIQQPDFLHLKATKTASEMVESENSNARQDLLYQKESSFKSSFKSVISKTNRAEPLHKQPNYFDTQKIKETTLETVGKETEVPEVQDFLYQKESPCGTVICKTNQSIPSPKQLDYSDTERIKETVLEIPEQEAGIQDSGQDLFYQNESPCARNIYNADPSVESHKQPDIPDTKGRKETALKIVETEMQDLGQDLLYEKESSGDRVFCEADQFVQSPKEPGFLHTETMNEIDIIHKETEMQHLEKDSIMISDYKPDFLVTGKTAEIVEKEAGIQNPGQNLCYQKENPCERVIYDTDQSVESPKQPDIPATKETALEIVEKEAGIQDPGLDLFWQKKNACEKVIYDTDQFVQSPEQPDILITKGTKETALEMVETKMQDSRQDLYQKESSCEIVICETDQFVQSPKQPCFPHTETTKETDIETVQKETEMQHLEKDLIMITDCKPDFLVTETTAETVLEQVEKEAEIQDPRQDIFCQNSCERVIYDTDQPVELPKQPDILDTKESALEIVETRQNLLYQKESSGERLIGKTDQFVQSPKQPVFLDTETTKETNLETVQKETEMQHLKKDSIMLSDCEADFLVTGTPAETALEIVEKEAGIQDSGQDSFCKKENPCERVLYDTDQSVESPKQSDNLDTKGTKLTVLEFVESKTLKEKEISGERVISGNDQLAQSSKLIDFPATESPKQTALETIGQERAIQASEQVQKECSREFETDQQIETTKNPAFLVPKRTKQADPADSSRCRKTAEDQQEVEDRHVNFKTSIEFTSFDINSELDSKIVDEKTTSDISKNKSASSFCSDEDCLGFLTTDSEQTNLQFKTNKETGVSLNTDLESEFLENVIMEQPTNSLANEAADLMKIFSVKTETSSQPSYFTKMQMGTDDNFEPNQEIDVYIKEEDDATDIEPDEEIDPNIFGNQPNKQEIETNIKEEDDATDIEPDEEIDPNLPMLKRPDFGFFETGNELDLMKMSAEDFARIHFPDSSTTFTISNIKQSPDEKPYIESAITSRNLFDTLFSPPRRKEGITNICRAHLDNNLPEDFRRECFVMLERVKYSEPFDKYNNEEQSLLKVIREELQDNRYDVGPIKKKKGRPRKICKVRTTVKNLNLNNNRNNKIGSSRKSVVDKDIKHDNESTKVKTIGIHRKEQENSSAQERKTRNFEKKLLVTNVTKNKIQNKPGLKSEKSNNFTTTDKKIKYNKKNINEDVKSTREEDSSDPFVVRKIGRPRKINKQFSKLNLIASRHKLRNQSRSKNEKLKLKNDQATSEKDDSDSSVNKKAGNSRKIDEFKNKNNVKSKLECKKEKIKLQSIAAERKAIKYRTNDSVKDKPTSQKDNNSDSCKRKKVGRPRKIVKQGELKKDNRILRKRKRIDSPARTHKKTKIVAAASSDDEERTVSAISDNEETIYISDTEEPLSPKTQPKKVKPQPSTSQLPKRVTSEIPQQYASYQQSFISATSATQTRKTSNQKSTSLKPSPSPLIEQEPKQAVSAIQEQNALNQQSTTLATSATQQRKTYYRKSTSLIHNPSNLIIQEELNRATSETQILSPNLKEQQTKENIEYILAIIANPRFCFPCNTLVAPGTRLFWFPERSPLRRMRWLQYCESFPHFVNPFSLDTDMYEHFMRNVKLCPKHFSSKQLIRDTAPTILSPSAYPDVAMPDQNINTNVSDKPGKSNDVILMPSCLSSDQDNNSSSQRPTISLKPFAKISNLAQCQPFNKSVYPKSTPQILQQALLKNSSGSQHPQPPFPRNAYVEPQDLDNLKLKRLCFVETGPQILKPVLTKDSTQISIQDLLESNVKTTRHVVSRNAQSVVNTSPQIPGGPQLTLQTLLYGNEEAPRQLASRNTQDLVKTSSQISKHVSLSEDNGMSQHSKQKFQLLAKEAPQQQSSSDILEQALAQPFLIMSGPSLSQQTVLETSSSSQLSANKYQFQHRDIQHVDGSFQSNAHTSKTYKFSPSNLHNKEYAKTIKRAKIQPQITAEYKRTRPINFPKYSKLKEFCCICQESRFPSIKLSDIPTKSEAPLGLKVWLQTVVGEKRLENFILENHHLLYVCTSHKAEYREIFRLVLNTIVHDHDYFDFKFFHLGRTTQIKIPQESQNPRRGGRPKKTNVISLCDSDEEVELTKTARIIQEHDNKLSENTSNDKSIDAIIANNFNVNNSLEVEIVEHDFTVSEEQLLNNSIDNNYQVMESFNVVVDSNLAQGEEQLSQPFTENNYQIEEIFVPEYVPIEPIEINQSAKKTDKTFKVSSEPRAQPTNNKDTFKIISPTMFKVSKKAVNKTNISKTISANKANVASIKASKNNSAANSYIDLTVSNVQPIIKDNNQLLVKNNKNLSPVVLKDIYKSQKSKSISMNNAEKPAQLTATSTANICVDLTDFDVASLRKDDQLPAKMTNVKDQSPIVSKTPYTFGFKNNTLKISSSKQAQLTGASTANTCVDLTASNVPSVIKDNQLLAKNSNVKDQSPIVSKTPYTFCFENNILKISSSKQAQLTGTSTEKTCVDLTASNVSSVIKDNQLLAKNSNVKDTYFNKKNIPKTNPTNPSKGISAKRYVDLTSSEFSSKNNSADKEHLVSKNNQYLSLTSNAIKNPSIKQTKRITGSNFLQIKHNLKNTPCSDVNTSQSNNSQDLARDINTFEVAQTAVFPISNVNNNPKSKEQTLLIGHKILVKMSNLEKEDPAQLVKKLLESNAIAEKIGVDKKHFVVDFLKDGKFAVKLDEIGHKQYLNSIKKKEGLKPMTVSEEITIIDSDEEVDSTKVKSSATKKVKKVSETKIDSTDEKKTATNLLRKYFQVGESDCIEIIEESQTKSTTSVSSNATNISKNSLSEKTKDSSVPFIFDVQNTSIISNKNSTNQEVVNETTSNNSNNEDIDLTDYMMEVLSSDDEAGKCVVDKCAGGDLLFGVPDDRLVLGTWQICLKTPALTHQDRVCNKHFLPSDIISDEKGKKVLKFHAIPDKTRNSYANSVKKGCCVPNCVNQNEDVDIMLPLPFWRLELRNDWLRAIKNQTINERFYLYRLCDKHFEPDILKERVVIKTPTRNLPEISAGLTDSGKDLEKKYNLTNTPETIKSVNLIDDKLYNSCAFKGCTESNQNGPYKMYFKIPSNDHENTFKWLNFMERDDILNKTEKQMKKFAQKSVGVCISHLGVELIESDPKSVPGTASSKPGIPQTHFKVIHDRCAVLLADKPDIVKVDVSSNKRKLMACRGGLKNKIQKTDILSAVDTSSDAVMID